ncbi:MAG: hypothetical protein ABI723_03250 [Bacteroidia bacterium]
MKSIKNLFLSVIAVISLTSMSFATPHIEKVSYHTQQLKQRINREFENMKVEEITAHNGIVRVSFYINENGSIAINESNYSDAKLFEMVKEKLASIQLGDSSDLAGKEFHYEFKFKVDDGR